MLRLAAFVCFFSFVVSSPSPGKPIYTIHKIFTKSCFWFSKPLQGTTRNSSGYNRRKNRRRISSEHNFLSVATFFAIWGKPHLWSVHHQRELVPYSRPLHRRVSWHREDFQWSKIRGTMWLLHLSRFALSVLQLRAGSSYHASGGTVHSISKGYIHGYYNYTTLDYDIGVLQVSSPFAIGSSGISVARLPNAGYYPTSGTVLYVSGWGYISVIFIKSSSKTIRRTLLLGRKWDTSFTTSSCWFASCL